MVGYKINIQNSIVFLYSNSEHVDLNKKYNTIDDHLQNEVVKYKSIIAIKEVQIKTTMRCHCAHTRMTKTKNNDNTKYWCGCEEVDHP